MKEKRYNNKKVINLKIHDAIAFEKSNIYLKIIKLL